MVICVTTAVRENVEGKRQAVDREGVDPPLKEAASCSSFAGDEAKGVYKAVWYGTVV
jgi:hypothetical protein